MSQRRSLRVTLTGDRSGEYVVVEERAGGWLVIAPTAARRPEQAPRPRPPHAGRSRLSGLFSRSAAGPATIVEALDGWGVELRDDEFVTEFLMADVDGNTGFATVTSQRFVFVAETATGPRVTEEHLLTTVRDVELIRRAMRHKLRVAWDRSETVIGAADRQALARLHQRLVAR